MLLITYWLKDVHPCCQKGRYTLILELCWRLKQIVISIEYGMGYHTSQTTTPYQTPSPLHFMTSFQSEKHWNCVLPHRHKGIWYGYCSE